MVYRERIPTHVNTAIIDEKWIGKALRIAFNNVIPTLFPEMQPSIGQEYVARPGNNPTQNRKKDFFIIALESGKPLIVYPDEFEILGVAEETSDDAATAACAS